MDNTKTNTANLQLANFTNLAKNVLESLEEESSEDFCLTLKESGGWNTYRDCRSVTNKIQACNVCQFQGDIARPVSHWLNHDYDTPSSLMP